MGEAREQVANRPRTRIGSAARVTSVMIFGSHVTAAVWTGLRAFSRRNETIFLLCAANAICSARHMLVALISVSLVMFGCRATTNSRTPEITVAAAANLTDAF